MTILGISTAVAVPLIKAVAEPASASGRPAPELDAEALAERFARAAWTSIAEPGDVVASAVIALLGAVTALEHLVARTPAPTLVDALTARAAELSTGFEGGAEAVEAALARWQPRVRANDVLLSLKQAARFGVSLVVPDDPEWPTRVDGLGLGAPFALWLRGERERLTQLDRSIAIVGARAATGYGEHVTAELAAGLVDRGYAIVSGAAYGIDGVAHRAALASGGTTLAILAGGLDRFYPSGHEALITRIAERGVVVSEVPCGVAPTKWRFLQRNRLIAAASCATIVVEAGWRSGSLNTTHHAFSLGRPVGAVPGPVTSSASAGCHRLLRETPAVCVTTPAEAAELLAFEVSGSPAPEAATDGGCATSRTPDVDGLCVRLLDALSDRSARTPEHLARLAGLALDRVRAELGLLELDGVVRRRAAGWVRVRPPKSEPRAGGGGAPRAG